MEIRTLRYFLTVVQEESITRAANVLHITQPTLSRQLAQMEDEMGVKLFDRGTRRITLTNEGLLLRRRAEEILELVDKTEKEMADQGETVEGTVSIGCGDLAAVQMLPELIRSFHEKYPAVTFELYTATADHIKNRMDQGLTDVGLLLEPVNMEKYAYIRLDQKEEWVVSMHPDAPLADREYITPRDLEDVLEKAKLTKEDISWIVSTGYGRVSISYADENVTEISCHGKGAHYFNPKIRTILDIGGQDSKAIRLNEKGEVQDFVMNDKCAAGTGRFLEMIARTLEISIDELGAIALTSTEKIEITSMCSVFAESEVISLIANNKEKADIADGVCHAIANKSFSLLRRAGMEPDFMMTGGVAKNPGVVRAVEEKIGAPLYICPEPEIVGAAGAALYALERMEER